jgi:transmembrane sensor
MALREERFKRFIRNECTSQEIEDLLAEFSHAANEPDLRKIILEQLKADDIEDQPDLPDLEEKEQEVYAAIHPQITGRKIYLWPRVAAAASVLLLLSTGGYLLLHRPANQIAAVKPGVFKNDINPGSNNAILTLSGGKQIILKNVKNGLLAKQGATQIQKTAIGELKYEPNKAPSQNEAVNYNTVTTKRGNKYDVTLPDGTIVYLDAASSIHFPTAFNGNSREVSITGQVYFEVAHDKAKPFRVTVKGETVEVLGTHFNINAYDDEPAIKTTLLEGSVRIEVDGQNAMLIPGQQAQIIDSKIVVTHPDLAEVMAWKEGLFQFNNTDLQTAMRQLSRWYDVDVVYQGDAKNYHFGGYISRDSKLSDVLRILQLSGVNFSIDGKKIIVYE